MKAGRALDALVAEKVMGLTVIHEPEWGEKSRNLLARLDDFEKKDTSEVGDVWANSVKTNLILRVVQYEELEWAVKPHGDYPKDSELKYYSTDIAAAWEVLEKMGLSVLRVNDGWYACTADSVGISLNGKAAKTASHAICLSALKVLGVDVSTAPASPSQTP